ncbi:MAG: CopG family transcriptional regulator, partial [Sulfurimonas sp.]
FSKATRPNVLTTDTRKVNVDFPQWVIESLDIEAKKIGVTRQSIIKVWIAERLKEESGHLTKHRGE